MKSNFFKFFFSLFFLLLTQYAVADEYVTCNKCTNFTNAAKKAITIEVPGSYAVHVADFDNEILKSYSIRVIRLGFEPGSRVPLYAKLANLMVSPTSMSNEFSQLIQIKYNIESIVLQSPIPPDIARTGWDLYADASRQNTFLQYLLMAI